jgi:hypothetical protein
MTEGVAKIAMNEIAKREDSALQDAHNRLVEARRRREAAFVELQGETAIDAGMQHEEDFAKEADTIWGELKTNRLKERFQSELDSQYTAFRDTVNRHTARESERLFEESNRAGQILANDEGARAGADADLKSIDRARKSKEQFIQTYIAHKGLDKTAAEAYRSTAIGDFHAGVIQAMADSDKPEQAKNYLSNWRGQMDPAVVRRMKKTLDAADMRQTAADITRSIVLEVTEDARKRGRRFDFDLNKAREIMRQNPKLAANVDLLDAVEARLDKEAERVANERRINDSEPMGRLLERFELTRYLDRTSPDYTALSDAGQAQIVKMVNAERRRGTAKQTKIDQTLVDEFMGMESEAIQQTDIDDEYPEATRATRAKMKRHQRRVTNSGGVESDAFTRMAQTQAKGQGYTKTKTRRFVGHMMDHYWAWYDEHGNKRPPREEVARWMARALQLVTVEGWFRRRDRCRPRCAPRDTKGRAKH